MPTNKNYAENYSGHALLAVAACREVNDDDVAVI